MTRTSLESGWAATDMAAENSRSAARTMNKMRAGAMHASLPALQGENAMKRWKHRPEGSTWGDWGDDDQLGRLNLITPKKVLEGIAEVKEGLSFCLSLPLDLPGGNVLNPRRLPPVLSPTGDENGWRFNFLTNQLNPLFHDVA